MARSSPFPKSEAVDIPHATTVLNEMKEHGVDIEQLSKNPSNDPARITQTTTAVPVEFMTQLLAMFAEKMNEGLAKVIQEARKVPIDPLKEKQKARAQEAKERAEAAYWAGLKHRASACIHRRDDGTSALAWAEQSDNVRRAVCQHCTTIFSPRREECVSTEVWEQYKELSRVPTQRGDSVRYV